MSQLVEIQPSRELKFIFEERKQSTCNVQLINKTNHHVAFKVKTTTPKKYCVRPNVGVVLPKETCEFIVMMQAQRSAPPDMASKDKFLVQSTIVPAGTMEDDVTSDMFTTEDGRFIEERKLKVVLVSPPHSPDLSPMNEKIKKVPPVESSVAADELLHRMERSSSHQVSQTVEHGEELRKLNREIQKHMVDAKSERIENAEPELTTAAEPERVKNVQPKLTMAAGSERVKNVQPELNAAAELESAKNVQPELTTAAEPERFKNVQSELTIAAEPESVKNVQSELTRAVEPDRVNNIQRGLTKAAEPYSVKNAQSLLATVEETEDVKNIEPELPRVAGPEAVKTFESEFTKTAEPVIGSDVKFSPFDVAEPNLVSKSEPRLMKSMEQRVTKNDPRLAKDIEMMKSKLLELESKVEQAEKKISSLTAERRLTIKERELLQLELDLLRAQKVQTSIKDGYPLLYVFMVAMIGIAIGFLLHP